MAQRQVQEQTQTQQQRQTQSVTQLQLLHAQLVELPITQLLERIDTEMNDNPALEAESGEDYQPSSDYQESPTDTDDYEAQRDQEDRQSALDEALQNIGRDDEELPIYSGGQVTSGDESEPITYGSIPSFYDLLMQQVGELSLTERQRYIMEYLIGSLDDDGLLRKSLDSISDELAVYHNVDVTTAELEEVLRMLQDFDPAGIGARTLQECLLLQIQRREPSRVQELMQKVVINHFDEFTKNHWDRIRHALDLTDLQGEALQKELRKLNPKPGAALGEAVGRSFHQIIPDFIIDTQDDGTVTFTLNNGEMPQLQVSQSFADLLKDYQTNKEHMSRQMKEALLYTKKKVDAAQNFIEAIRLRRHTLTITMQAIIRLQHRFFEDGDEASLRPMILKDIAELTGLDLSTISRVSNSKYAQTRWGTFPLRYFFSDSYTTETGEELSTRAIKVALRDLIDSEDKKAPLNDDALKNLLAEKGFPIARRTVAKYREQLGIPIARLRK